VNIFQHDDDYCQYLKLIDDSYFKRILDHLELPIFVLTSDNQLIFTNPEGNICMEKFGSKELMSFFSTGIIQAKECLHSIVCSHDKLFGKTFSTSIVTPVLMDNKNKNPAYYIIAIQKVIKNFDDDARVKEPHLRVKKMKKRNIIGRSHEFLYPLIQLERISRYDITILLLGESGTGKTLIAEYIHNCSNRCNAAFVSINCGAIPAELLESELFGYAPGAFTGANRHGKEGLFQRADGGTIFLDEIGDMPLNLQVKLLHVLENSTFVPVGGNEPIKIDVRIIAATNKDLLACINEQTFRNDLYWRINSFMESIPPLRERKPDIVPLALFFLKRYNLKNHTNKVFYPQTLQTLTHYQWPGNVRELKNVITQMCVLTDGLIIYENVIPKEIRNDMNDPIENSFSFDDLIDQIKEVVIKVACKKNKTSTAVARELRISQPTAYRLMKTYGTLTKTDHPIKKNR
jgi:transcriptional regulator with PAS, ATPase and Fis domain